MDMAHSVGVSQCRPYSDSPNRSWIRWYKAEDGAKVYPGWTWSGSPLWQGDPQEFVGPGVFLHPSEQRLPIISPEAGDHYAGTPDQFQYGLPVALAGPVPVVCGFPLLQAQGGVVIGGTGWGAAHPSGQLMQAQRIPGSISTGVRVPGAVRQSQFEGGSIQRGVRVPGAVRQSQFEGGATSTGYGVSGRISQAQTSPGTTAVGVRCGGLTGQAQRLTGSITTTVVSAGIAAEASGATGSTATTTVVRGTENQAQTVQGQTPIGAAVQGSLAQAQTLTGTATGSVAPTNPITTGCSACAGGCYVTWTGPTVSGISGAGCSGYNTTITLVYSGSGCVWNSVEEWGVGRPKWIMTLTTGPNAQLNATGSAGSIDAVYLLAGSWACLGSSNVLTFLTSTSCSGWPATITLTS